ncbi:hypothetical protein OHA72_53275 [Dactylosporangium sp. NBC_01737]|uniref:tetratricopeptide repeat protein n=1 Tax=Dactylosporangium sp. NBC_01737 TaxID=2975959 RepID=UPI002E0DF870|nr:hypothetical protein OHA72_53275 [Dactylosporangium sp. NBC_01737]
MSRDEHQQGRTRPRLIDRAHGLSGPSKDLKDALYELYLRAGAPTLDQAAEAIRTMADDLDLPGVPTRASIGRIIGGPDVPPGQHDVVAVAMVLARMAGRDGAAVADHVRDLWIRAKMTASTRLGRPIGETDPHTLEIHRAIDLDHDGSMPVLPGYVTRPLDAALGKVVAAAAHGTSRIAVLVGGSSTGKTRACWEAVQALPDRWRLWHPYDPTRPGALVEALDRIDPFTVLWLNESQHYLLPADAEFGERIAAGLRALLADPNRGPVLVLGTMWPEFWEAAMSGPAPDRPDPNSQARDLLSGHVIFVPETFTDTDMTTLRQLGRRDPRLRNAAEHAVHGRVTQHLAGVPLLLDRYRAAPPAARAVILAAIDAHRFGCTAPIPAGLLADAAPGYFTDPEWDQAGETWFEQALGYVGRPCHGTPGPVTLVRPRSGDDRSPDQAHYRLADYLHQVGRAERADVFPPPSFWSAVMRTVTAPEILIGIAAHAERRGRYGHALPLYRLAVQRGGPQALNDLARLYERAGETALAQAAATEAAEQGDTTALRRVARRRQRAGDLADAQRLLRQAADRDDRQAMRELAWLLAAVGDLAGAQAQYQHAVDRGDVAALRDLVAMLERAGDAQRAEALAAVAAERGDSGALRDLAGMRERAGDHAAAEDLYRQAADHGDVAAVQRLARLRESAGDLLGAASLYRRAVAAGSTSAGWDLDRLNEPGGENRTPSPRNDPSSLWQLALRHIRAGDTAEAYALVEAATDPNDPEALRLAAAFRERVNDLVGAEAAYVHAAERGSIGALRDLAGLRTRTENPAGAEEAALHAADRGDTGALRDLARWWERADDLAHAAALYQQAVNRGDRHALHDLAWLWQRTSPDDAARLRKYGLTADGEVAHSL